MSYVEYAVDDHVAIISINRPERSNAMGIEVQQELLDRFLMCGSQDEVRVVLLRSEGGRAFCAGADLKERYERDRTGLPPIEPMAGPNKNLFEVIRETYKPVIACVNGAAVAGGMELALSCDIRIVSDDARFGLPEVKRSMGANFASVVLPRIVPPAVAFEMLYTGDYINAEDALRIGLVNHVIAKADVEEYALSFARKVARNAPLSLRRFKEMIVKTMDIPVPAALRMNVGPNPYVSQDRIEGIAAFVEHREPHWQGK